MSASDIALPHAPQLPRPARAYLVTACTCDEVPLFREFRFGRLAVQALTRTAGITRVTTLGYMLLPERLQWLVAVDDDTRLAGAVRYFKEESSRTLARACGGACLPVWERLHDCYALRGAGDLGTAVRHLLATPLRAGLVQDLGDYPFWDLAWL